MQGGLDRLPRVARRVQESNLVPSAIQIGEILDVDAMAPTNTQSMVDRTDSNRFAKSW